MTSAAAAAIRKSLGCAKNCSAAGPVTHVRGCPAEGRWLEEVPRLSKSREPAVPVSELEALVTEFRASESLNVDRHDCADQLQALIDKVTP